jgi:hypothetical protein
MLSGLSNVFIYRTLSAAENVFLPAIQQITVAQRPEAKRGFLTDVSVLSAQYHCGGQLRSRVALRSIEFALLGTSIMHSAPMFGAIQMQLI